MGLFDDEISREMRTGGATVTDTGPEPHALDPRPLDPGRAGSVGASEVPALFSAAWFDEAAAPDDLDPMETRYGLWMRKAGRLPPEPEEPPGFRDRRFWGSMLEAAIARGVEHLTGLQVAPGAFVRHPLVPRMSASTDFEARGPDLDAVLEVKNVDRVVFRRWPRRIEPGVAWLRDGEWRAAEVQPPFRFKLQVQAQLACTGKPCGLTAALVGGNELLLFRTERHDGVIARIEREVAAFWASVDAGAPPAPDWQLDAETVSALCGLARPESLLDLRGDPAALELARRYALAQEVEAEAKRRKKAAGAEILHRVGDAERALFDEGYSLWAGNVAGGHRSYDVDPHRGFLLTQRAAFKNRKGR